MSAIDLILETTPLVTLSKGVPVVTSMEVAKHFEKHHKNVLRDIRRIGSEATDRDWRELNFELTFQTVAGPNNSQRKDPYYLITREGFMILGMGFTGSKAMGMKIAFVKAFTAMEQEILSQQNRELPPMRERTWSSSVNGCGLTLAGRCLPVEQKVCLMNNATQIAGHGGQLDDVKAVYADLCNTVADGSTPWTEIVVNRDVESVRAFVEECTEPCANPREQVMVSMFYAAYAAWCDAIGEGYPPMAQLRFMNLLRRVAPEAQITRPRRGLSGHRPYVVVGLALNDAWA